MKFLAPQPRHPEPVFWAKDLPNNTTSANILGILRAKRRALDDVPPRLMKFCILAAASLLLAACSHDNPLKTNPRKESARFLMHASANVETRLHFPIEKENLGIGFLQCINDRKTPPIDCTSLFNGIINFAKEGHYPKFKELRLSDLKDKDTIEDLEEAYANVFFLEDSILYPKKTS